MRPAANFTASSINLSAEPASYPQISQTKLKVLYNISEKLRAFFGMEPPQHFYNFYSGSRKIRIDLVAANVLGSAIVVSLSTIVLYACVYLSRSLRLF